MVLPVIDDPAPPQTSAQLATTAVDELFCPECGYNLHGIEGITRCPECGLPVDREGFARSQVPWVHRRHVGRFRAYWRTVWLATFQPRRIAAEASRRVSYCDAQRFRWVTAFVAAIPVIAGLVAAMAWYGNPALFSAIAPSAISGWAMSGQPSGWFDLFIPWDSGATMAPVLPLAVLIVSVLVTGLSSYWFHPAALSVVRQNRAVALSYYACGPLALVSIPMLAALGVFVMKEAGLDDEANASWAVVRVVEIIGVVSALAVLGATWRSTMVLLNRTTRPSSGRLMLAGLLIPLKWALCAAGVLLTFPWLVGTVRLVITSLR